MKAAFVLTREERAGYGGYKLVKVAPTVLSSTSGSIQTMTDFKAVIKLGDLVYNKHLRKFLTPANSRVHLQRVTKAQICFICHVGKNILTMNLSTSLVESSI